MEMLLYLLFLIVGFVWGYRYRENLAMRSIDTFAEKIQNDIQQTIANTVYITIERQGDTFFVYDSKTSKFLTQSSDRKELAENLKKMFPNKRLAAKQENIREVGLDESL